MRKRNEASLVSPSYKQSEDKKYQILFLIDGLATTIFHFWGGCIVLCVVLCCGVQQYPSMEWQRINTTSINGDDQRTNRKRCKSGSFTLPPI